MVDKSRDLKIIRGISSITLKKICDELDINFQNVYNGKTTKENLEKIREKIESEVAKLYVN